MRYYNTNWCGGLTSEGQAPNWWLALLITIVLAALLLLVPPLLGFRNPTTGDAIVFIEVESGGTVYSGSGAIIHPQGNIVTNKHVVFPEGTKPDRITVWLYSGTPRSKKFDAVIKGLL